MNKYFIALLFFVGAFSQFSLYAQSGITAGGLIRLGKGGNLEWKESSLENFDENY